MGRFKDLSGNRFGKVLILSFDSVDKYGRSRWKARCDCEKTLVVSVANLRRLKSCGCGRKKHGASSKKIYFVWRAMRSRCGSPSSRNYKWYGARGIKVFDRWNSFELFLEDMGEAPPGTSLDRIDNEKGYYKENCRWVTQAVQARNSRWNRVIEFNGESKCVSEWARIYNIHNSTLTKHLNEGWSLEKAFGITK